MKVHKIICLVVEATIPLGLALYLDCDLSSDAHIAVIGVTATAVALCDALFGQIVAMVGEMPFRGWKSPAEAKRKIKAFDLYHKEVFFAWISTKLASSFAVMLPAVTLAAKRGGFIMSYRKWILGGGYLALGIALAGALFFLVSYWNARNAANRFQLDEITRDYKEKHLKSIVDTQADRDAIQRQYEAMSRYDAHPQPALSIDVSTPPG